MTMLIKLADYYRECKILSCGFDCKHRVECQGDLKLTRPGSTDLKKIRDTFTQAKSALIGDRYGDEVPRLLFVSLDPGSVLMEEGKDPDYSYVSAESRTPEGVQKGEIARAERIRARRAQPSPRLRETNKLAGCMLRKSAAEAIHFYAHVNAVKCTMNKESSAEADKRLFRNCREYLRGEIDILAPDVIFTLGKQAKRGIEHAFSIEGEWACEQVVTLGSGKETAWFPSYHMSSYGPYKKQEQQRNQFVQAIRERFSNSVSQK